MQPLVQPMLNQRMDAKHVNSLHPNHLAPCIIGATNLCLAVSINTSNSYGDFELRSRRFHFNLVYFENLV